MKITSESKLFIGIGMFTTLIIALAAVIFSQPSKPLPKEELILPTTHTKGNKDAKTWLVEFSDFQCPACHAFSGLVKELADKYPDTLLIAYRHFPLDQHPEAQNAARAAEAAGNQGKFWEMEEFLFDNQASLSASLYREIATSLGLDMTAFEKSMSDPALANAIEKDRLYGEKIGITATPTFYLNGAKLELRSVENLKKKVEEAINSNK